MAGTMSQADLVADLKASLNDASGVFESEANDAAYKRHLDHAAMDMGRIRRRVLTGYVSLVADQSEYDAPAAAIGMHRLAWGDNERRDSKPWDSTWPGRLPRVSITGDPGVRKLSFFPAPSSSQISLLGATCSFFYYAAHAIGADAEDTTVRSEDRGLLLLRAQAEAMKELAMRNIKKPVALRDGMTGTPRNGTPSALYQILMESFGMLA